MSNIARIMFRTLLCESFINSEKSDTDTNLTAAEKYLEFKKEKQAIDEQKAEKAREEAEEKAEQEEQELKAAEKISLSNEELQRYTLELRQAMKEDSENNSNGDILDKIVYSDDITDGDFAKIVTMYNQKYGNGKEDKLIQTLGNRLKGEYKDSILGRTAERLMSAAQDEIDCGNTNGVAIQTLNDLVHSTKFENMDSAAKFIEEVMNGNVLSNHMNTDKAMVEKIQDNYSTYTDGDIVEIIDMYS